MKKLMLSAIILLPLIILLILSVSTVIVSSTNHIYVENVEIVDAEQTLTLIKSDDTVPTYQLKVNIFPMLASNKNLVYWSDDDSVASVDKNGVIYGNDFGTTYIYVKSQENEIKTSMRKVVVTDTKVHRIEVANRVDRMYLGDEVQLEYSVKPSDAENTGVTFSSDNPSVLSVSLTGLITAVGAGEATVTLASDDGNASVSFVVSVKSRIENATVGDLSPVYTGKKEAQFPQITFYPAGAFETVTYISSDDDVASVSADGFISFKKAGTVTVTANVDNTDFSFSKTYTSTNGYANGLIVNPTSVSVEYSEYADKPLDISVTVSPADAAAEILSYEFSNGGVAEMRADGKIYVIGGGQTTLTVSALADENRKITQSVHINVNRDAEDIVFTDADGNAGNVLFTFNSIFKLKTVLTPADATSEVEYSTASDGVYIQAGNLVFDSTAAFGTATVRAQTQNGLVEEATVVYINSKKVVPVCLDQGTPSYRVDLPLAATGLDSVDYVFYTVKDGLVSFTVTDGAEEGLAFTAQGTGVKNFTAYINGEEFAFDVEIYKTAENFEHVEVFGIFDDGERLALDQVGGGVYTSAKRVEFGYTLYPSSATLKKASVSVLEGDAATVAADGSIVFGKAGRVKVELRADSAYFVVYVESTCGHPDGNTAVTGALSCYLEEKTSFSINEIVTKISPDKADISKISIRTGENSAITVTDTGIAFDRGLSETVYIDIEIAPGIVVTRETVITVYERPQGLDRADNYVLSDTAEFDLGTLFDIYPESANTGTEITYSVISGSARLDGSTLCFNKAGAVTVKALLENGTGNTAVVLYAGDLDVLPVSDGGVYVVERGVPFMIEPSPDIAKNVADISEWIRDNITLTDGIFVSDVPVADESIEYNASVTAGEYVFKFKVIVPASSVSLSPESASDADVTDEGLVTALEQIKFAAATDAAATFKSVTFAVDDDSVAEIDKYGTLTFKKEGTVTVRASSHNPEVFAELTIRSTFGKAESANFLRDIYTPEFDNDDSAKNTTDYSGRIKVFPSQAELDSAALRLVPQNGEVLSAVGFNVTLLAGGESYLALYSGDELLAYTLIQVKRDATGITLNGKDVKDYADTETVENGMLVMEVAASPEDANRNNDVTFEIVSVVEYAEIKGNVLVFYEAGQSVEIAFRLGSKEIHRVSFVASNTTMVVDQDADTVTAPYEMPFNFLSAEYSYRATDSDGSEVIVHENGAYKALKPGTFTLKMQKDGTVIEKTLVITRRAVSVGEVILTDYLNGQSSLSEIVLNNVRTHITASSSVGLRALAATGVNANGSAPSTEFELYGTDDFASLDGNVLTFTADGKARIRVTTSGVDYFGPYTLTSNFYVQSSFGKATSFSLSNPFGDGLVMDDFKGASAYDAVTVTAPLYGLSDKGVIFTSLNPEVLDIGADGNWIVNGTGSAVIVATAGMVSKQITVKVDKYMDGIAVRDSLGRDIVSDITGDITYKINAFPVSIGTESTLNGFVYSLESFTGEVTLNTDGTLNFAEGYGKAVVLVAPEKGKAAGKRLTVIKVPGSVTVYEIYQGTSALLQTDKDYVFDAVGEEFAPAVLPSDVIAVNAEYGVFRADSGKQYLQTLGGRIITVTVVQPVEEITVSSDTLLTAADTVDLVQVFTPSFRPSTAYGEDGPAILSYSIEEGFAATLAGSTLRFASAGAVKVRIAAQDKYVVVTVESTCGAVKSAEWTGLPSEFKYANKNYTVSASDYLFLPSDIPSDLITVKSLNPSVAVVSGNIITFVGGGYADIVLEYADAQGQIVSVAKTVLVHKPVTEIQTTFDGFDTDVVVFDRNPAKLSYRLGANDFNASPYTVTFESGDTSVATADADGNLLFKVYDVYVDVTLKVISSDGSVNTDTVKVKASGHKVLTVTPATPETEQFVLEKNERATLFAIPGKTGCEIIFRADENASLELTGDVVYAKSGGIVQLSVITKTDVETVFRKINVFVHEQAQSIELNGDLFAASDNLVTIGSVIDLDARIYPASAAVNKTIRYTLTDVSGLSEDGSGESAAAYVNESGELVFTAPGTVSVLIEVLYGGNTEASRTVTVRSSMGQILSFILSVDGTSEAGSEYVLYDIGESITFSVRGISPADYSLDSFDVSTDIASALTVSKNADSFTVTAKGKSRGTVTVKVGDIERSVIIDARIKSKSIEVKSGSYVITDDGAVTFAGSVGLSAMVYPLNSSDLTVLKEVSGDGYFEGDVLYLPSVGKYTVTLRAADGGAVRQFVIEKLGPMSNFALMYGGEEFSTLNTSTIKAELEYNNPSAIFKFAGFPDRLIGEVDYGAFTVTAASDMTLTRNGAEFKLQVPAFSADNPSYYGEATVKYNGKTIRIIMNRVGISSIEFVDHDNAQDTAYGLQQVRLFGKTSYYGGKKNYYKMKVNIQPASVASKAVWTTSNSAVTVTYNTSDGYAYIYFNSFNGLSTADVKNNVFDKYVTVTAKDLTGAVIDSYTFNVVNDAVNVFDQAGFVANSKVVLHVNLGDTEEESYAKFARFTATSGISKSLIYGNGFVINYNSFNNTYNKDTHGNNVNTGIGQAYNAILKGSNFDAGKGSYHNCFGGSALYYCKIQQSYKGTWASDGMVIKNCLFRYMKDMSIQISNEAKKVYIENIISIDGGNAAIESQVEAYYLKGFIDVYNFKNKDSFKDILGAFDPTGVIAEGIISRLKNRENGRYVNVVNGDNYFNVVVFYGKTGGNTRPMYFWNEDSQTYVAAEQGNAAAAPGLTRLTDIMISSYSVWSYGTDYIDYYDQYKPDGTENFEYLAQQEAKLLRTSGY